MLTFWLNHKKIQTGQNLATVLLDFIRRDSHLPGTKEGCREGDCGACTVLLGRLDGDRIIYRAVNSCLLPIGSLQEKHVVTIEGLNLADNTALQDAFIEQHASQCGFCTPGFIVSLTDFLLNSVKFEFEEALETIAGNICRCTGYTAIRRAIARLIEQLQRKIDLGAEDRIGQLISAGQLPDYFAAMPQKLAQIEAPKKPRPGGKIIAGGTDLFVQQADQLLREGACFIQTSPAKNSVFSEGDCLVIPGNMTMEDVRRDRHFRQIVPTIDAISRLIASKPIRERATLAGNIVNASPIADFTILLLALNATLELQGKGKNRRVSLSEFYHGYKTLDLQENERIENIRMPQPPHPTKINFEKISRRTHLDIASVNSAACIECTGDTINQARISAGGVAPVPLFLRQTSAFLSGQKIENAVVEKAMHIAAGEISPISDVRGSAGYKRRLLQRLIFSHFYTLFPNEISAEVPA